MALGQLACGDRVGSEAIAFAPGPVRPGEYSFDIGTAGATSLVLQTLLLPLALADGLSELHTSEVTRPCTSSPTPR